MNELTPQILDQQLYQDPRKPLRKIIDDTVVPNLANVLGPPAAAISALGNIQRKPTFTTVG